MAFTRKTKSGAVQVVQGNNGRVVSTFRGKGASAKAKKEVSRLHKKNKPKASNRGSSAKKKAKK